MYLYIHIYRYTCIYLYINIFLQYSTRTCNKLQHTASKVKQYAATQCNTATCCNVSQMTNVAQHLTKASQTH